MTQSSTSQQHSLLPDGAPTSPATRRDTAAAGTAQDLSAQDHAAQNRTAHNRTAQGRTAQGGAGLWVHRSAHPERLVAGLAEELAIPLANPFTFEVVSVPTHGVERWLSQSLSAQLGTATSGASDGVCAGIDFITLHRLLDQLVLQTCGIDPASDPWRPSHATWALLEIIDRCAAEATCDSWFQPLRKPFSSDAIGAHRWASADRVLKLFAGYAAERPDLLAAWRDGQNTDPDGAPLTPMERWQPELWRRLRQQLATDAAADSGAALDPAARQTQTCAALVNGTAVANLPTRISIFGPSRLSPAQTQLIGALSAQHQVHLWLPQPSPVLWQRIAESDTTAGLRSTDSTATLAQNLLNRRLGRDARELQVAVQSLDFIDVPLDETVDSADSGSDSTSVLARLQQSVALDVPVEQMRAPLGGSDRSITFHACHGPDRQVDVLRDEVLSLLAQDPTLEPRDIIVMCPDIEAFAPLLAAAFHSTEASWGTDLARSGAARPAHPAKKLRIRLADRSLRQLNPLLATLSRTFELHSSRAGLSHLIDLCADPAVATRFGFHESDHERLVKLSADSGIRWGLDAEHRKKFEMGNFSNNTWQSGLERMLLGIATSGDGHWAHGGVVPLDDIDSGDVALVGRLAELVDRVDEVLDGFAGRHSLTAWIALCRRALELLTATSPTDAWQLSHAWSVLADLGESDALLDAGDVRALLADAFAGRPTRANFGTGALTICSMMPMRSVPHRVVITLGMDDGEFPRRAGNSGDDLRTANPRTGDRDPRSEDRQVLLDAVLAARERFIVIYSGASPHSGEHRQPCVPVLELRDAVTGLCQDPVGDADSDPWPQLEHRHPLQPHSPANFSAKGPFSFDPVNHRAAAAHLRPRATPPATFTLDELPPLPSLAKDVVDLELEDLDRFFRHPVKSLLRKRALLNVADDDDTISNEIPIDPGNFELWAVGDRMLKAHLTGTSLLDLREAELQRGELPPGQLGLNRLTEVARHVRTVAEAASGWLDQPARTIQARVQVGKYRITGMLGNIRGNRLVQVTYSSLKGKQRLSLWLHLLLLTVARPEHQWTAVLVGRHGAQRTMGPVNQHEALAHLNALISLYSRGSREPLIMPPNCAAEYAEALSRQSRPNLERTWEYEQDPAWLTFVGKWDSNLYAKTTPSGESEFIQLAREVWTPILQAESRARSESGQNGGPR